MSVKLSLTLQNEVYAKRKCFLPPIFGYINSQYLYLENNKPGRKVEK